MVRKDRKGRLSEYKEDSVNRSFGRKDLEEHEQGGRGRNRERGEEGGA